MRKRLYITLIFLLFLIIIFNWSIKIVDSNSHAKYFKVFPNNGVYTKKPLPFIYGTIRRPIVFDPIDLRSYSDVIIIDQVAETLFTYNYSDPSLPLIPLLATGYSMEPTEKLNYTIYLHQGIVFHDGSDFNSIVAKWNFDRMEYWWNFSGLLPDYEIPGYLQFVYYWEDRELPIWNRTEIVNEYTIKFILNKPHPAFLHLLTHPASAILSMQSTPFYSKLTLGTDQIIGTGPFVFDHYYEGIEIGFHAFENYWREKANIEQMVFKYFSDLGTLNSETLLHNVNFIDRPDNDLLDDFKSDPDLVVLDAGMTDSTIRSLAFNNFLLNNTIRKALSYAINYSHIIDVMMEGTSIRLKSPIPSGILYSNTTFNYPIFNITKARIIMQSTGHGTTLDPNYPGLNETDWDGLADRGINNFSMWVLDIDQFRSDLFNLCSKTFRKIGINLYKKETDGITFNNMMEQDPNWVDMWTTGFVADYNDPSNFINFMFSNISIGNLKHFGQVNDSYLQNLINLGTEEFDPVLRKGIYDEIQRYLVEELMPSAWLYIDKMYHVHGNYLTGFSQNVMEKTYFYYCTWLPHTYKVSIESSRDYISFLKGSTGKNITWTIAAENVENPTYNIFIDDVLNETRIWQNNDSIIIKLNNLPIGIHELKIEVINAPLKPYAYTVEDVVIVNIYTNEIPFPLEMVIIIVVLIVITMIIAGMVVTKRRSSRRRVILDEGKVVVSIPEEKSEEVEIIEEAVEEIVEEKPEEVEIIEEAVEEIVEEKPEEVEIVEEAVEEIVEEKPEEVEIIEEAVSIPEEKPEMKKVLDIIPIQTFEGHLKGVTSVTFSPNGKYVVSSSKDKTIKIWELSTGKLVRTLEGHKKYVNSVVVSSDGKYIISCSNDKTVKIWDFSKGELVRTLKGHTFYVLSVAVSPDNNYVVSSSFDKEIKVWDLATGKLLKTLKGHTKDIGSVAVSPDGKYIVSGSNDNTIKIWELLTGNLVRTLPGHKKYVTVVVITADGKYIISGSGDKTVKVWEFSTGYLIRTFTGHTWDILSVAVSPDNNYVISSSFDKEIKVWDLATGKLLKTLTEHRKEVGSISISPDFKYIISGSNDKTIKIWSVK